MGEEEKETVKFVLEGKEDRIIHLLKFLNGLTIPEAIAYLEAAKLILLRPIFDMINEHEEAEGGDNSRD